MSSDSDDDDDRLREVAVDADSILKSSRLSSDGALKPEQVTNSENSPNISAFLQEKIASKLSEIIDGSYKEVSKRYSFEDKRVKEVGIKLFSNSKRRRKFKDHVKVEIKKHIALSSDEEETLARCKEAVIEIKNIKAYW